MKRRTFLKKSALATAGLAVSPLILSSCNKNHSKTTPRESFIVNEELKYIVLNGSPRQRGQVHGETLRTEIAEIIEIWKEDIQKYSGMKPDKFIDAFLEDTSFLEPAQKWTPNLLDEVKGIAEGSGIDFKTIFAFQCMDEQWWYIRNKKFGIYAAEGNRCTALGVYDQKGLPPLVAQNMDLESWKRGYEVLLHIKHQNSATESFVYSFAGFLATNGMNNVPIGVCLNALLALDNCLDGLPIAFIVRGILEQRKYSDAVKFIHDIKHASGQSYIIGGPQEVVAFECSANQVKRFIPYQGANRLYHTNHPLVNNDLGIYQQLLKKDPSIDIGQSESDSEVRLRSLEKQLKDPSKRITIDTIKSILSSHDDPENPVCRDLKEGKEGYTFGSVIYELSYSPMLHLAPGPPCSTGFNVYKF